MRRKLVRKYPHGILIDSLLQVIVLNSTDGFMIGETQTLLRNLAKETNNGQESATLAVSDFLSN